MAKDEGAVKRAVAAANLENGGQICAASALNVLKQTANNSKP